MTDQVARRLPAIGLGTMGLNGTSGERLIEAALAEGYRHLDTARRYGNEDAVGRGLRRSSVPRDEVVVTTKLWFDELEPAAARAATLDSLSTLGLEHIDLLLVHWPNPAVPVEATFEAIDRLRDEGRVRFAGAANFPVALLSEVATLPYFVGNQVEYHPYLCQRPMLSALRDQDLTLTAYCPLGRGGALLEDDVMRAIAEECGRSVAQVALRWLCQQDGVVAIPGTSNIEHLRANLAAYDFELTADQMARIDSLARGERVVDPPHAPVWD